jgi:hypothetical protein
MVKDWLEGKEITWGLEKKGMFPTEMGRLERSAYICCAAVIRYLLFEVNKCQGLASTSGHDLSLKTIQFIHARPSSPPTMNFPIAQAYASQVNTRRYRIDTVVAAFLLVSFALYQFTSVPHPSATTQTRKPPISHADDNPSQLPNPLKSALPLPPEYHQTRNELAFCAERFGLPYLHSFSKSSTE